MRTKISQNCCAKSSHDRSLSREIWVIFAKYCEKSKYRKEICAKCSNWRESARICKNIWTNFTEKIEKITREQTNWAIFAKNLEIYTRNLGGWPHDFRLVLGWRLAASAKIYRLANAYNYLGGSRVGKKSTAPLSPGSKPQLASLLQVSSRMTMTHEISFEFSRQSNGAAVASATQSRPKRQRGGIISPIRQGHMALAWRNNLRHPPSRWRGGCPQNYRRRVYRRRAGAAKPHP